MNLVFASSNKYKTAEICATLPSDFIVKDLHDIGWTKNIEEPYLTLEENAKEKVMVLHKELKIDCFSEDTGLEVTALNGEPGVRSARYAGNEKNKEANIQKVLVGLESATDRTAQFRAIFALYWKNNIHLFEGVCKGTIALQSIGSQGFGYDAIFIPQGSKKTFAQMDQEEKINYSHRTKALNLMIDFLKKNK